MGVNNLNKLDSGRVYMDNKYIPPAGLVAIVCNRLKLVELSDSDINVIRAAEFTETNNLKKILLLDSEKYSEHELLNHLQAVTKTYYGHMKDAKNGKHEFQKSRPYYKMKPVTEIFEAARIKAADNIRNGADIVVKSVLFAHNLLGQSFADAVNDFKVTDLGIRPDSPIVIKRNMNIILN